MGGLDLNLRISRTDKTWNSHFSTLLSAEYKAYKSDAKSAVTGASVIDSADLFHVDLALLNKVGHASRMGLGLSYGQDIFIAIDPASTIPTSFLIFELAPFLLGDFCLREMNKAELRGQVKVTYHSGEAETAHDTKKGYSVLVGMSFERVFHKSTAWTLGLSFESSDQARVGMTQKRSDANMELGLSF